MRRGTVDLDPDQAKRLAEALAHRRVGMGFRSFRALARETGLDPRTINALESAEPRSVDRSTLTTLEIALNWPSGTIDQIISGAGPYADLRLNTSTDVSADVIDKAMHVAQAAFDAYIATYLSDPTDTRVKR
jgi:hypothetical protein